MIIQNYVDSQNLVGFGPNILEIDDNFEDSNPDKDLKFDKVIASGEYTIEYYFKGGIFRIQAMDPTFDDIIETNPEEQPQYLEDVRINKEKRTIFTCFGS